MTTINDILAKDPGRVITRPILVDVADEERLSAEIREYFVPKSLAERYREILQAIADSAVEPLDNATVLTLGWRDTGKTSFVKYLGHALENPVVHGERFSDLMAQVIGDSECERLLQLIGDKVPFKVIFVNMPREASSSLQSGRLIDLILSAVLRELDYSDDFVIAALESELEEAGKLAAFIAKCHEMYARDWSDVRKGILKYVQASAVLHELDPHIYPDSDSWAESRQSNADNIPVADMVERVFEFVAHRCPGKAFALVLDDLGLCARSVESLLDLQITLERFASLGQQHCRHGRMPAPCWIFLTSIQELGNPLDTSHVGWAKLQDKLRFRVALSCADLGEVVSHRMLSKTAEGTRILRELFEEHEDDLNLAATLDARHFKPSMSQDTFAAFYPLLPHYVELCLSLLQKMFLHEPGPRLPNVINLVQDLLVSGANAVATKQIGSLVTLADVFDVLEHHLPVEKRMQIRAISDNFEGQPDRGECEAIGKVISLLENMPDIPPTHRNIAALLVGNVRHEQSVCDVEQRLERLASAGFAARLADEWKLLNAQ